MRRQAVHPMQREMLIELFESKEPLQRRSLHAWRIGKAHVILNQRQYLPRLVV